MGRPRKASPATARLAGVVKVSMPPLVAVMAVCAASEIITEGGVCASLCVDASQKNAYSNILLKRTETYK